MLRIALLVMLFVLLSADYSSLVSTVFTALGGSVVAPTHSAADGHRKVPTAPGDLGPLRRSPSDMVAPALHDGDEDEDEDDDVEDVFDFGGSTAKLFSEYLLAYYKVPDTGFKAA